MDLDVIFERNRQWAAGKVRSDAEYFQRLSAQQEPKILWIGCADSRVPANEICGLQPGELFVHRNVANIVTHTDFSCLSVLQYAVDVLKVKDVILCGHYGCGGVRAALETQRHGLIDNWLRHIRDVHQMHEEEMNSLHDPTERAARLCELNVAAQVANLCYTTIVQDAWARDQELVVHGWIYDLEDGLLRDLNTSIRRPQEIPTAYQLDL